jgi:hypothetical protein
MSFDYELPKLDDPLRVFCETSQELICLYDLVSNCYNENYKILQMTLKAVKKKKKDLIVKITDLLHSYNEHTFFSFSKTCSWVTASADSR